MSLAPSIGVDHGLLTVRDLLRQGRIDAALAALDAVPARVLRPGSTDQVLASAQRVEGLLARGDLAGALAAGGALEAHLDDAGLAGGIARYSTSDLHAAVGETELAADRFRSVAADVDPVFVPWRNGAALALLQLGRRAEAVALTREQMILAVAGSPYDLAAALRILAIAEADGGGVARLREALGLLADLDAYRLRATITVDLAGLLVLEGGADEAVVLLREAEAYAARERLVPLQGRIRRLLERLGETPRRREAEALAELTAAEGRVAVLALEGLTNRQIAERLDVSVKAVEGHLSKVYRKLGVASRAALLDCLHAPV